MFCSFVLLALTLPAHSQVSTEATEDLAVKVSPAAGRIGIFYSGVTLEITGKVPEGSDIAVKVSGTAKDLTLRYKKHKWGMFWAPAGEIDFQSVPGLYLLRTSVPLDRLAAGPICRTLGLGLQPLGDQVSFHPTAEGVDLLGELIEFEQSEGLYSVKTADIRLEPADDNGLQLMRATFQIPRKAPPAAYRIDVDAFHEGRLLARGTASFELSRGKFIAAIAALARHNGFLYGLAAVVAALAMGLLTGIVFGSSKAH